LAAKEDRSLMNVTFTLPNKELTSEFLDLCTSRGMINLKGYRAVGGVRASIYNGMPLEGVQLLAETMKEFEQAHK
ncbi:MAG: 3-phosphoserine/phosphohydroxythreonine aminotransferase, partial [Desulfovibrionaceae bacterium]|nr:3-phosphoserine/phosphohydroxythreonine aminotransferase [Desulfovibrionaceae bacterium]